MNTMRTILPGKSFDVLHLFAQFFNFGFYFERQLVISMPPSSLPGVFESSVLASRCISWSRKSSFLPVSPLPSSSDANCLTWLRRRASSSAVSPRSAWMAASWARRAGIDAHVAQQLAHARFQAPGVRGARQSGERFDLFGEAVISARPWESSSARWRPSDSRMSLRRSRASCKHWVTSAVTASKTLFDGHHRRGDHTGQAQDRGNIRFGLHLELLAQGFGGFQIFGGHFAVDAHGSRASGLAVELNVHMAAADALADDAADVRARGRRSHRASADADRGSGG
jgi:hypothetical protein